MWSEPAARRRLLRFLLASPLLAKAGGAFEGTGQEADEVITAPELALDVMDFEAAARKALPPAHFGYLQTGVDDDATLRANREGFARFSLRVRRLVDVRHVDMSVSLFGTTWDSPIALAPVAAQRAFHPEGEIAVARAARTRKHLMLLSTVGTSSVEDVAAARGEPIWYQLYPTDQWPIATALIKRAEAAGCPALVLTVDLQGGTNRLTAERARRRDRRNCASCHGESLRSFPPYLARKPMFDGLDVSKATDLTSFEMSWEYVKRLRELWPRKLLIKGIVTREDAQLAVQSGVDGLVVSNHGGRAEESGRSANREPRRGRGRREGPAARPGGQRLPPRYGRLQGARPRRHGGLHRPAVRLGAGGLRTARRRGRPRRAAPRAADGDAAGGDAAHRGDRRLLRREERRLELGVAFITRRPRTRATSELLGEHAPDDQETASFATTFIFGA